MPKLTEAALKDAIKTEAFLPVYCLHGDEAYLIQHYVSLFINALVGEHMPDFNLTKSEGETATMLQILEAAEALPVMHNHRCIVIRDFVPTQCSDKQLQAFSDYLAEPCPGNVLIFYYTNVTPGATGRWKAFLTACEQYGGVIKLNKKTEKELVTILCNGAGKRGCRMSSQTAAYLIQCIGCDLNTLLCELEKLCAFRLNQQIEDRDVDLLCSKSLNASAFQMIKEINRGQSTKALQILQRLFALREEPIKIMGALASSYVNLYRAMIAEEAGIALPVFAKELGMKNPNSLQYSLTDARRLGTVKLTKSLKLLSQCDLSLKSLPVEGTILLEQTVVGLLAIAGEKNDA